jgi:hypothetical protein
VSGISRFFSNLLSENKAPGRGGSGFLLLSRPESPGA